MGEEPLLPPVEPAPNSALDAIKRGNPRPAD